MAINATVDGSTYTGIDTITTGGKTIGLAAEPTPGQDFFGLVDRTITSAMGSASIVGIMAFANCAVLESVSFPNASMISSMAFYQCPLLSDIYLPMVSEIGTSGFYSCGKLENVNLPLLSIMRDSVFYSCASLKTVSFPELKTIGSDCFRNCPNLSSVNMPLITSVPSTTFFACNTIGVLSFPEIWKIYNNAFGFCFNLVSLYLMSSAVVQLNHSNAFNSTPIGGYTSSTGGILGSVYVPSSLVASYQTATNWTFYSERIVGV